MSKVEIDMTSTNTNKSGTVVQIETPKNDLKNGAEVPFSTTISGKDGVEVSFEIPVVDGK